MVYKEWIDSIYNELVKHRKKLEAELGSFPAGYLHIFTRAGKEYYYETIPNGGNRKKEKRIGITQDPERVSLLVRKQYVQNAIKVLDQDIAKLEDFRQAYIPFDENSVMQEFILKHSDIAGGIYHGTISDKQWVQRGSRTDSYGNGIEGKFEGGRRSTNSQGIDFKSKGEMFIASRLEFYGIPFRYEQPLGIPDLPYIPDFTLRRPRDRKIIFWEHLGMVNDYDYMNHQDVKLSRYRDYGITPWDNLIVTYDNASGGIDGKIIDAMIQGWLL